MDDVIKVVVDDKEDKLERVIVLQVESRKTNNIQSNEGLDQGVSKQKSFKTNTNLVEKQCNNNKK